MDNSRNNRQRNTYLLLVAAGLFLLIEKTVGFFSIIGILLLLLGIQRIRGNSDRKGYVILGIGLLLVAGEHFTVILALVLIAVGYYYLKTRDAQPEGPALERKHFIQSVKHDQDPWVLRSMSYSHVVGETRLDLSLAIFEEKEVTLVLRGLVGDIDVIIPDDVGVCVEGSILFGQLDVGADKGAGVMNRLDWHSPNYASAENRVKLIVSFIVGDIDIKVL